MRGVHAAPPASHRRCDGLLLLLHGKSNKHCYFVLLTASERRLAVQLNYTVENVFVFAGVPGVVVSVLPAAVDTDGLPVTWAFQSNPRPGTVLITAML